MGSRLCFFVLFFSLSFFLGENRQKPIVRAAFFRRSSGKSVQTEASCVWMLFRLVFRVGGRGDGERERSSRAVSSPRRRSIEPRQMRRQYTRLLLSHTHKHTQTRCLLLVHMRERCRSFCWGGKREKGFSFESILLLFRLGRRAERNECSVFMGPNTEHQVHTLMLAHTQTHTEYTRLEREWRRHINEMRKVREENKHVRLNARRANQR